ncbi:hypothetical protein CHUAL_001230 [Chamberlinius hualienensis]
MYLTEANINRERKLMSALMKTRNLVFSLIFLVATGIIVYVLNDQQPSFQTIVSETHKQLNNLKSLKDNLKAERKELSVDEKYQNLLGFTPNPRLYPSAFWHNVSLPVIVTAVEPGDGKQALSFIYSVRHHFADKTVIMYDLGLSYYESNVLTQSCNSSTCSIKKFNFDDYPAHISDISIKAYRPLIIQDMLNSAGAVLWLDIHYHPNGNKLDNITLHAATSGLVAWGIEQPTSALTHPRMFEYFHAQQQNFYFHHLAELNHVILYNLEYIHSRLMLPWVQCSLIFECIAPIGAQGSGCRFDKKPMYRYSGCHRYDTSAFNVALGVLFNFNDANYTTQEKLFRMAKDVGDGEVFGENNDTTISNSHEEYVS